MPDRFQVLAAVYQSERTDRAATQTVSLATIGAGMTYLVGTIAFYDKLDLLAWTISLLPFPLLCIAAFHSQLLNVAAVRARSILILEHALLTAPGLNDDRTHIGVTASEHATNIHTAATPHRFAMVIAYGGLGVIHLAYTVLMLVKAARHITGWVAIPSAFYLILLIPIALAWRDSTRKFNFRTATSPDPTAADGAHVPVRPAR